jgi:hypothetical protein
MVDQYKLITLKNMCDECVEHLGSITYQKYTHFIEKYRSKNFRDPIPPLTVEDMIELNKIYKECKSIIKNKKDSEDGYHNVRWKYPLMDVIYTILKNKDKNRLEEYRIEWTFNGKPFSVAAYKKDIDNAFESKIWVRI